MSIAVIDQGAELFWFVSGALISDEIPLKHLKTKDTAEEFILHDLPLIVVINDDDSTIDSAKFIGKMRNHVFARNTLFIVVTSETTPEHKRDLIISGAGQIFYKVKGQNPSPKYFRNVIKWFLNIKNPDPQVIEYKPVPFSFEGEFTTYGRVGWISHSLCLIEINLELKVGDTIEMQNDLFDELDIKEAKLSVLEKDTIGRYYQYTHGYLCKIISKKADQDKKKLTSWIESNQDISKHKPIKVVYFEQDPENRKLIKDMIKFDKRYCARGYSHLENFIENLNFQLPHLILIDRQLISANKKKFDALKKFLETHFCYCITYDNQNLTNIEEFKKDYNFIMHLPQKIEINLLESMIIKLEEKLNETIKDPELKKVYLNKYSPYSRLSIKSPCHVTELAISGIGLELPFPLSPYCAFEITVQGFTRLSLNRMQFFRNVFSKRTPTAYYHQCLMLGQTITDNTLIKMTVEKIKEEGFEKWKQEP